MVCNRHGSFESYCRKLRLFSLLYTGRICHKQGIQVGNKPFSGEDRASISAHRNLAGCSLIGIVEEELMAVGIIYHQEPISPRTFLYWNALGFEFCAQRVQRSDRALRRRWLNVQGNEHQPLTNLLRPRLGQDKRAALPIDL